jgi:hypothetical protein
MALSFSPINFSTASIARNNGISSPKLNNQRLGNSSEYLARINQAPAMIEAALNGTHGNRHTNQDEMRDIVDCLQKISRQILEDGSLKKEDKTQLIGRISQIVTQYTGKKFNGNVLL